MLCGIDNNNNKKISTENFHIFFQLKSLCVLHGLVFVMSGCPYHRVSDVCLVN